MVVLFGGLIVHPLKTFISDGGEVILFVVGIFLVVTGILGAVLPALPGAPLSFLGFVLIAWADDFSRVGGWVLLLLGLLTIVVLAVDIASTVFGARRVGASKLALLGATIGAVGGIFFGLIGILLAPFFGAVIGELLARRDLLQAGRVGVGTWIGIVIGSAVKLSILFSMIGVFVAAYLF